MNESDLMLCAVCGRKKQIKEFGDGIRCPGTTCLECFEKIRTAINLEKEQYLKIAKEREGG